MSGDEPDRLHSPVPPCPVRFGAPSAPTEAILVLVAGATFVGLAVARALDHPYPFYDDVAYLKLGQEIHALGGPWALLRELYAGRFAEANRHPLYVALLSALAGTDVAYHRRAQVFGICLGLLGLAATWWTTRRLLGAAVAVLTLGCLALNGTLLEHSAREACEGLLLTFWVLSVGEIVRGDAEPWRWPLAGAWAGLAYLTKGTGLFLPISFALTLLLARGWRALTSVAAWGFALSFLLVSSPLLVRNTLRFGAPFYNVNSRYLWANGLPDFAELFAPGADTALPQSLRDYVARTSGGDLLRRLGRGVAETIFQLGDSLALVSPRPGGVLHIALVALGLITAAVALRLAWRARSLWSSRFILVHVAWSFSFFVAYNAVAGAGRYFLPVAAVLTAVAARAELDWATRDGVWHRSRAAAALILPLAAVTALALDPASHRPPPGFVEAQTWLRSHVLPGEGFAIDSRTQFQPGWLLPGTREMVVSTSWRGRPVATDELLAHLRSNQIRYLVIDGASQTNALPGAPLEPRYFFHDRVRLAGDGSVPLEGWPAELAVAYAGEETPRRWLVLSLGPETGAVH